MFYTSTYVCMSLYIYIYHVYPYVYIYTHIQDISTYLQSHPRTHVYLCSPDVPGCVLRLGALVCLAAGLFGVAVRDGGWRGTQLAMSSACLHQFLGLLYHMGVSVSSSGYPQSSSIFFLGFSMKETIQRANGVPPACTPIPQEAVMIRCWICVDHPKADSLICLVIVLMCFSLKSTRTFAIQLCYVLLKT